MRLSPIIATGLALLVCSCQQMKFPWDTSGTSTFGSGSGTGWGQPQAPAPAQPTGVQWGQGTWGNTPPANNNSNQGWGQPANQNPNQGWNQNPPQNPNQGWGNQSAPPPANNNWANDGWNNASEAPAAASGRFHVVGRGDTLTSIATRNGTTVRRIMQANNISDPHRIQIGQRLAIP